MRTSGLKYTTDLINLDSNETRIRDNYKLKIHHWAIFRASIGVGNDAGVLQGAVTADVRYCYRELAKSHYEAVTSLGCCFEALNEAKINEKYGAMIPFRKPLKDFYSHIGIMLDHLSRLAYIINVKDAPTLDKKVGLRMRHWMDFGKVAQQNLPGYDHLFQDADIKEIRNVRNGLIHGWTPLFVYVDSKREIYHWVKAVRNKDYVFWPYDPEEMQAMQAQLQDTIRITDMIDNDFKIVESFMDRFFEQLGRDIPTFEANHAITIV
jgi:hypothetical protein